MRKFCEMMLLKAVYVYISINREKNENAINNNNNKLMFMINSDKICSLQQWLHVCKNL